MFGFSRHVSRVDEFEKLVRQLTEEKGFRKKGADFGMLCSSLRAGRVYLENMMYDVAGMSGDDVLKHLRRRKPMISD